MDFWAENNGQPPLYKKRNTIPGCNYTHLYDKHQADFQSSLGELQEQGREPSCWFVPATRPGGVLQGHNYWTYPYLLPSSSQSSFAPNSQPQQFQRLEEYWPQDKRERDWSVREVQRTDRERGRENERRIHRDGWQRRWIPCGPVSYRREVAKRSLSDSSYRELEAWAARYSHSLPRRSRIKSDLSGSSQEASESDRPLERSARCETEPKVATMPHPALIPFTKDLGQRKRECMQQTTTQYLSQTNVPKKQLISKAKENKMSFDRKVFDLPPDYIAPPSYYAKHNSLPLKHHSEGCSTCWDQRSHKQTSYPQASHRQLDYSACFHGEKTGEELECSERGIKQCTYSDPRRQTLHGEKETEQSSGFPSSIDNTQAEQDCLEQIQQTQSLSSEDIIKKTKLSFKKRRGRETIFCLVSRMGGVTGLSSSPEEPLKPLPLFTQSHTNVPSNELENTSIGFGECCDRNVTSKLTDELDCSLPSPLPTPYPPTLPTNPKSSNDHKLSTDWMRSEQVNAHREELLRVIKTYSKRNGGDSQLSNTTDVDVSFTETFNLQDSSVSGELPPVLKYPLWREPVLTYNEHNTSSSPSNFKSNHKNNSEPENANREGCVDVRCNPTDIEVRRLEIKKDEDSESSNSILVIDTTHVVVRVDLISYPKKEHVQYVCSSPESNELLDLTPTNETIQLSRQNKEDEQTEQSTNILNQIYELEQTEGPYAESDQLDTYVPPECANGKDTEEVKQADDINPNSFTSPSLLNSENETLSNTQDHTERIIGMHLKDASTQDQTEKNISILKTCVLDRTEEDEMPHLQNNVSDVALTEMDVNRDQLPTDDNDNVIGLRQTASNLSAEASCDCPPKIQVAPIQETEITSELAFKSFPQICKNTQSQLCDKSAAGLLMSKNIKPPFNQSESSSVSLSTPPQECSSDQALDSDDETHTEPISSDISDGIPISLNQSLAVLAKLSSSSCGLPHDPSVITFCPEVSSVSDSCGLSSEETQYPEALWDAVNRIRKHTAPDSDNEEEDICELWDPENGGQDLRTLNVTGELNPTKIEFQSRKGFSSVEKSVVLDKETNLEVQEEDKVECNLIRGMLEERCPEKPSETLEDDTLSCSSTDSHWSRDTVVMGAEGGVEEQSPDSETERKMEQKREVTIDSIK